MSVSITQVSPSSTYAGPWVPIVLDVTTTNITTYTYILATIGAQQVVVWGDGTWNPLFSQYSTRTELVAGTSYRYSILPNAGWRAGFTVDARAGEESYVPESLTSQNFDSSLRYGQRPTGGGLCSFERTDAWTFATWIKIAAGAAVQKGLCCKVGNDGSGDWRGWQVGLSTTNLFMALYGTSTQAIQASTSVGLATGAWLFIASTYDGSSSSSGIRHWVGAVEQACSYSGSLSSSIINTNIALSLGAEAPASLYARSRLFEPMVFDGALSQAELESIRDAADHDITGLSVYAKIRHHWRFGRTGKADLIDDLANSAGSLFGYNCVVGDLSTVDVP